MALPTKLSESLASQTSEYRNDEFVQFVSLVNSKRASVSGGTQQRQSQCIAVTDHKCGSRSIALAVLTTMGFREDIEPIGESLKIVFTISS